MAVYFYKKFAEAPADDKGRPKIGAELAETEAGAHGCADPLPFEPARPAAEMAAGRGAPRSR